MRDQILSEPATARLLINDSASSSASSESAPRRTYSCDLIVAMNGNTAAHSRLLHRLSENDVEVLPQQIASLAKESRQSDAVMFRLAMTRKSFNNAWSRQHRDHPEVLCTTDKALTPGGCRCCQCLPEVGVNPKFTDEISGPTRYHIQQRRLPAIETEAQYS